MSVDFSFNKVSNIALKPYCYGDLTIYINSKPIWATPLDNGEIRGIRWTWNQLLAFLLSNWIWILNEQNFPIYIDKIPNDFYGLESEIIDKIEKTNKIQLDEEQKNKIRHFCLRHDLSSGMPGIVLPHLFVRRINNSFLFTTES